MRCRLFNLGAGVSGLLLAGVLLIWFCSSSQSYRLAWTSTITTRPWDQFDDVAFEASRGGVAVLIVKGKHRSPVPAPPTPTAPSPEVMPPPKTAWQYYHWPNGVYPSDEGSPSGPRPASPPLGFAVRDYVLMIGTYHFEHTRSVTVPCWFLSLLLAALPATRLRCAWRERHRRRPGHCSACGYDLRGSPAGGTCPECGTRPAAIAD